MEDISLVAKKMVEKPKGILAMDESTSTMGKRLVGVGLEDNENNRRAYRGMLVSADGLGNFISGAILFEETLYQEDDDGKSFVDHLKGQGIIPGIKVDLGLEDFGSGEKVTKGLDGLSDRLEKYKAKGAKFAKWRAVIIIDNEKGFPTQENIEENAERLAKYAKICQDNGIVPIVEPEVLMDGNHSIEDCERVTADTLKVVFDKLKEYGIQMEGMVLKPNMIVPGKETGNGNVTEVAEKTFKVLSECVPKEMAGIAFLSGGIGDVEITQYLNAINKLHPGRNLTFSFGRGLQREALAYWAENQDDVSGAQEILLRRSKESSDSTMGKYE